MKLFSTLSGLALASVLTSSWTHALPSGLDRRQSETQGYYSPATNGGSMLTGNTASGLGEPLNVIVSGQSDSGVLSQDGFEEFSRALYFSPGSCLNISQGGYQTANLGDGNGAKPQTNIMRYNFKQGDGGTCLESLKGGNHFRYWIQNGTAANSGAIFIAASVELNATLNHAIAPNGYDDGRDQLVGNATAGTLTSPGGFQYTVSRQSSSQLLSGVSASQKKGVKSLNTKKGRGSAAGDSGKRPAQGERKAQRKRIVLSNDNALEVSSLQDLSKENVLNEQNEGKVMGLPQENVVDALRAVEAFKTTQGWSLFRRPAVLMRKEAIELARLFKEAESSKKTIRRILSGQRMSGKSTLVLQGLTMGILRDWFVINLPEAQDLVNAHTEYAPLPNSEPMQYTQDAYTANLLQQILQSNGAFLAATKLSTQPELPLPLPAGATLKELAALGMANPEASWPVFVALWNELSLPGRPPILLAVDGLSHIMRHSEYMSAEVKPIHAHDLTLVRHFVDHLSGQRKLPNGGMVLGATSRSNAPASPAMDYCIEAAEARQKGAGKLPPWNPYKNVDARVMEALKGLHNDSSEFDIIDVGGLTKEEARSIMEYYAESGMLRHQVNEGFVTEKWSLAGMGNIGELEKASVRMRL